MEAEGIDLARVRRVFASEVKRAAHQRQKVLDGDQVPHFLAGYLLQRRPERPHDGEFFPGAVKVERVGREQVMHHQKMLDLRGRREPEDRLVSRLQCRRHDRCVRLRRGRGDSEAGSD